MADNILKIVCALVYVVIAFANAAPSSKLPKGFIQCKINDPGFDECLKIGLQSAIPHLGKGVPSLGINQMDPLRITSLLIDQGTGPVSIKLDFKDLDISNMKSMIFDKIHYNVETKIVNAELHPTKPIMLEGDYEISGKVLVLPIVGKGKCKISLDISKIISTVQFKTVIKNGTKHLEIVKFSWKFDATNMKLKMENLFNGDKVLGDNMNLFLNENWRELIIELKPAIEEVFGKAYTDIAGNFLNCISADQIFLNYN